MTPALFDNLLDFMRHGHTVAEWIDKQRELGNPISRTAVMNYKNADSARKSQYSLAREDCADAMVEDTINIADTGIDPQRTANRIKSRQWMASKVKPKEYGDKLDIDVRGQIDVQSAVLAGRRRIQQIEDATYSEVTTTDKQSDVVPLLPAVDPFS